MLVVVFSTNSLPLVLYNYNNICMYVVICLATCDSLTVGLLTKRHVYMGEGLCTRARNACKNL